MNAMWRKLSDAENPELICGLAWTVEQFPCHCISWRAFKNVTCSWSVLDCMGSSEKQKWVSFSEDIRHVGWCSHHGSKSTSHDAQQTLLAVALSQTGKFTMVSFTSLPLTNPRRGFGLLSFFRGRSVEFSSVVVVLVDVDRILCICSSPRRSLVWTSPSLAVHPHSIHSRRYLLAVVAAVWYHIIRNEMYGSPCGHYTISRWPQRIPSN